MLIGGERNVQMVGKSQAGAMYRAERPKMAILAPERSASTTYSKHAVNFWLTTEDLPLPENRVTLDRDGGVHLAYTLDERPARPTGCTASSGRSSTTPGWPSTTSWTRTTT